MRKFILETLTIFILSFSVIIFLYHIDKPTLLKNILIAKELEIINLGNSHGSDFDYTITHLKGGSFNKDGNTAYYDLQNYKYLKKSLKDSCIILIPVSFFTFGLDENRSDQGKDNSFVNDFYEYLPKEMIYSYSKEKLNKVIIYRVQENFKNILISNKKKNFVIKDEYNHVLNLNTHAIKRAERHKQITISTNFNRNIKYLTELLEDANSSGFRPILVTTPFYKEYGAKFNSEWLNENFYSFINILIERTNTPYLDYSKDKRLDNNHLLYYNSDHLLDKGKKEFSKIIFDDLVSLNLINSISKNTNY